MVEVFKTNVSQKKRSTDLIKMIQRSFPEYKVNFDLEDCDRILRVEANLLNADEISNLLRKEGFTCEAL